MPQTSNPLIYKGSLPFKNAFGNVLATKTELSKNKELTDFLIRQLALFLLFLIMHCLSSTSVRCRVRHVRALSGSPGKYNAIHHIPLGNLSCRKFVGFLDPIPEQSRKRFIIRVCVGGIL